jgi:hypothetical protein
MRKRTAEAQRTQRNKRSERVFALIPELDEIKVSESG